MFIAQDTISANQSSKQPVRSSAKPSYQTQLFSQARLNQSQNYKMR